MLHVTPLRPEDQPRWTVLARGYKTFYETTLPDDAYATAWQRLLANDGVHALGARLDGELVGITHYLFHASVWSGDVCYLQDLFTDPAARGKGVARALIEAVAEEARRREAPRMYWTTHHTNATARLLYDRIGRHAGFLRYDYPMG